MKESGNTILITGGGTGIGFALAAQFLQKQNTVIICGRREEALREAVQTAPGLIPIRCDLSDERERVALFREVTESYPSLNVLINNAGIQNRLPPLTKEQDWRRYQQELAINLEAPLHLSMLFLPHFQQRPDAAFINVSSGLAFVPIALMPVYCASKAALHSFTMSLREQLKETSVEVFEAIPPPVKTDLGGIGLHDNGVPVDEYARSVIEKVFAGEKEFGYGTADRWRFADRSEIAQVFQTMNDAFAKAFGQ